jgi:Bacterial DNA-binding protein
MISRDLATSFATSAANPKGIRGVSSWRRRESKTSINPDTSGACTDSRAPAATFVRSGRFEFGTVGSVWATYGQGVLASEFAGFAKFIVVKKPATRKGINPLTKEPTVVKAKPERKVVRARLVRAVRDAFA